MTITNAKLDWKTDELGNLVPISNQFDDVYFSYKSGRDESFYVFCKHNDLPARFLNQYLSPKRQFCIIEIGFGTGLNFLVTAKLWIQSHNPQSHQILHFITTEKYPLSLEDLTKSLSIWQDDPILSKLIDELLAQYPIAIEGCHRLIFEVMEAVIVLDLWLGDAKSSLLALKKANPNCTADAWFLDGFAPNKNHDLWSYELFTLIADLSCSGTTLATFSAAGEVRRNLLAVGACIQKVKGFGSKREMLTAHFDKSPKIHAKAPPKTALVIGAGVAGLMSAYSLALRGVKVIIIDRERPLACASGNPRAMLSPKLSQIKNSGNHLPTQSFLYASACYDKLNTQHAGIFAKTGVVDFMLPTQKSADKIAAMLAPYPDALVCDYKQYAQLQKSFDNNPPKAYFLANSGLINPHKLAAFVLSLDNIQFYKFDASRLIYQPDGVICMDKNNSKNNKIHADMAVICMGNGSHLLQLPNELTPIFRTRQIRGQVSWTNNPQIAHNFYHHYHPAIKYDGYACVFKDLGEPKVLFGASFVRNCTDSTINHSEHQHNLDKLRHALPHLCDDNVLDNGAIELQGRAAIRAQTPDYHPITGQINPRIFINTAFGSKGFGFAPLCGEIIASMIMGEFLPINEHLSAKINPNRPSLKIPLDHSR